MGGGSYSTVTEESPCACHCLHAPEVLPILKKTFPPLHYEAFAYGPKANLGPSAAFESADSSTAVTLHSV